MASSILPASKGAKIMLQPKITLLNIALSIALRLLWVKVALISFTKSLKYIVSLFAIILTLYTPYSYAGEIEDRNEEAMEIYENLTCETAGVGDLFRTEFSHTCITAPFFDFLIASILSPGLYVLAVLKLKINDDVLFPSSCARENRINPHKPKITFGICNNILLAEAIAESIAEGTVDMIADLAAGKTIAEAIQGNFKIEKKDFTNIYEDKEPGDEDVDWDLTPIPWKVVEYRDQICIATQGITGWMNVGCRYMKEPYPDSIYDLNPGLRGVLNCSRTEESCYHRAKANAANMISITGPIVTCVRDMLLRLIVNPSYCGENDEAVQTNLGSSENLFFKFQRNMYVAVSAFLTLYVIFVGFNIVLGGELPNQGELIMYALKIILVIYFSVGINTTHDTQGFNGMSEWVFPILFDGSSQLTTWIMGADHSGLCTFTQEDYDEAIQGYWNLYSIWDSLDCRVLHYLGLNFASDTSNSSKYMNFSIPPYMLLLIPAIYTANITLIMLSLAYPLLIISVAAYFVNSFIISLICIVILGILAPLFVPMVLFQFTKGYFTSWFKLLLSFTLQPMVVATFLTLMFAVYDSAFYTSCKYNSLVTKKTIYSNDIDDPHERIVVAERYKKVFFLDTIKADYDSEEDFKQCFTSLGGMFNITQSALFNEIAKSAGATATTNEDGSTTYRMETDPYEITGSSDSEPSEDSPFNKSKKEEKGIFFSSDIIIFEYIRDLIVNLFTCVVILYLMKNFAEQLSEFAADITEGVSLGNTTIGANAVSDKVNSGVNMVKQGMGTQNSQGGDGKGGDSEVNVDIKTEQKGGEGGSDSEVNVDVKNDNGGRSRGGVSGGSDNSPPPQ
jgi:type IV secretion system protein VirB6